MQKAPGTLVALEIIECRWLRSRPERFEANDEQSLLGLAGQVLHRLHVAR